jgi:hypothetical protein
MGDAANRPRVSLTPGQTAVVNIAGISGGLCMIDMTVKFQSARSFIRMDQRPALEQAFAFGLTRPPSGTGSPVPASNRFMLIMAHTDLVGQAEANRILSLRRANTVLAVFTVNPQVWEDSYRLEGWNGPNSELAQMSAVVDQGGSSNTVAQYVNDPVLRLALFGRYLLALRPDWLAQEPSSVRPALVTTPSTANFGCGLRNPRVNTPGSLEENRRAEFFFFNSAAASISCAAYPARLVTCGQFISIVVELTNECGVPFTGSFNLTLPIGGTLRQQQTDAQGRYTRDNVPPGQFTVEVDGWRADRTITATNNIFRAQLLRPITSLGTALRRGGQNFRFFGTNAYYLLEWAGSGRRSDVEDFFRFMREAGIQVVRTWGFNENQSKPADSRTLLNPTASPPVPQINSRGIASLATVVSLAAQFGIYLIITLGDYNPHYGGICQYARWAVNTPANFNTSDPGGFPDNLVEELFYTGTISSNPAFTFNFDPRTLYLDFVCQVINRFRGMTNILAWELMNEPRVKAIGAPSRQAALEQDLRNWIGTTAQTIRQRCNPAPQLLSIGGVDINLLHFIFDSADVRDNVDLMDTHLYPENFGFNVSRTRTELMSAITEANTRGKPFYLGEGGLPQGTARNRPQEYQDWATLLLGGGASGMFFWQLLPRRMSGGVAREAFDLFEINVDKVSPPRVGPLQNVPPPPGSTRQQPGDGSSVIDFVNRQLGSSSSGGWSVC